MATNDSMALFAGNANPVLAQDIARHLAMPLGRASVGRFSDGEVNIEIMENVRGRDVFIIQSTSPPANDHLMELVVMVDACRRASAARITAVVPYFGYARQDRRPRATRMAITAKVVANMISSAGVNRMLTIDLHADQIQGFFDIPVDNVYGSPVLLGDAWRQSYQQHGRGFAGRGRRGARARARQSGSTMPSSPSSTSAVRARTNRR